MPRCRSALGAVSLGRIAVISMLRSGSQEPVRRRAASPLEVTALPSILRHLQQLSPRCSRVSFTLYSEAVCQSVTEMPDDGTFPPCALEPCCRWIKRSVIFVTRFHCGGWPDCCVTQLSIVNTCHKIICGS